MGTPFTQGLLLAQSWIAWGVWGGLGLAMVVGLYRLVFGDV